jgi:hypothetical protein
MITVRLNVSMEFDDVAAADFVSIDDFSESVCAHMVEGLECIPYISILFEEVYVNKDDGEPNGFN